jgi:nitrate reductase cytochrome c-type subunit
MFPFLPVFQLQYAYAKRQDGGAYLDTLEARIEQMAYTTVQAFVNDFENMILNCIEVCGEGSPATRWVLFFSKIFMKIWSCSGGLYFRFYFPCHTKHPSNCILLFRDARLFWRNMMSRLLKAHPSLKSRFPEEVEVLLSSKAAEQTAEPGEVEPSTADRSIAQQLPASFVLGGSQTGVASASQSVGDPDHFSLLPRQGTFNVPQAQAAVLPSAAAMPRTTPGKAEAGPGNAAGPMTPAVHLASLPAKGAGAFCGGVPVAEGVARRSTSTSAHSTNATLTTQMSESEAPVVQPRAAADAIDAETGHAPQQTKQGAQVAEAASADGQQEKLLCMSASEYFKSPPLEPKSVQAIDVPDDRRCFFCLERGDMADADGGRLVPYAVSFNFFMCVEGGVLSSGTPKLLNCRHNHVGAAWYGFNWRPAFVDPMSSSHPLLRCSISCAICSVMCGCTSIALFGPVRCMKTTWVTFCSSTTLSNGLGA